MKRLLAFVIILLAAGNCLAQRNEILSSRIGSLKVTANDNWAGLPITTLDGTINIDFDDLTHQYTRYTYRIEHCEADWTPSEGIFSSEYLQGFAEGNTIGSFRMSMNTVQLYNHYHLEIPNNYCSLKMSGNYRLTVIDENNGEEPVLVACFMIVEPLMGVSLSYTTNTDLDINSRHQQVEMEVSYGPLKVIMPTDQIKTVVMQNGRWDNARINVPPQFTMADGLRWQHCRDFIFTAGNEYRKFEILDLSHPTMGIDHISWDGSAYHVYPFVAEPRWNYVYDEDADGAFIIRNSDNIEIETTCDYSLVHFQLKCPKYAQGEVYVNGEFTNDQFLPQYRMEYDYARQLYEAVIPLKQGYYNYQFLLMDASGNLLTVPCEGDYYQTQNTYQALVYYRGTGERTDRLVGYAKTLPQPSL